MLKTGIGNWGYMSQQIGFTNMANFSGEAKKVEPLTSGFIRHHARILSQLNANRGGKRTSYYLSILEQYKDNPLKFDREFETLRQQILETY